MNDFDDKSLKDSPVIHNNTKYPIVVFCERGILYNEQVLHPGEAVTITRNQTGGGPLRIPYKVHAVIGNETSLPTWKDSIKNVVRVSAVPTAFVAGWLITAASAGTLAGPSAALAPLVSGLVVKGVVIDTAAIAAGTLCADRAQKVAETVLAEHKEKLMCVTPGLKPENRYLSVTGGLADGPVTINDMAYHKFNKLTIKALKVPINASTTSTKQIKAATTTMTPTNAATTTTLAIRDENQNQMEENDYQKAITESLETHQAEAEAEKEDKELLERAFNLSLLEKEEEQKLQQVIEDSLLESMVQSKEEEQLRKVAELSKREFEQHSINNVAVENGKKNWMWRFKSRRRMTPPRHSDADPVEFSEDIELSINKEFEEKEGKIDVEIWDKKFDKYDQPKSVSRSAQDLIQVELF